MRQLEKKWALEKLSKLPYPDRLLAAADHQYRFMVNLQETLNKKKLYNILPAVNNAILNTLRLEGELTGDLSSEKTGDTTIIIGAAEAREQLAGRMDLVLAKLTAGTVVEGVVEPGGVPKQLGVPSETETDPPTGE